MKGRYIFQLCAAILIALIAPFNPMSAIVIAFVSLFFSALFGFIENQADGVPKVENPDIDK